jgi:hypothetical protein
MGGYSLQLILLFVVIIVFVVLFIRQIIRDIDTFDENDPMNKEE